MQARIPARTVNSARTERFHPPHSPPPPRRLRIAGADLSASVAVFLIALPLSLGIALATGAPLQAGLVAAAVGGLVAGRLGGCPLQVSGPAAGLTVVTADLIHRYGWRTTCAITVLAGLVQLGLGCLRVARGALAVSPAVVHGMLAGIGVTIAVAQLHIVLGGSPQSSVLDNLRVLPAQLTGLDPAALAVSALTLALLLSWPRLPGRPGGLLRKVPSALVAVAGATAVARLGGLPVAGVAVRSSANVHAGAVSRDSTMLHGVLVLAAALLMVPVLELVPLASLAALVMAVGIRMVSLHHIRTVTRHQEVPVYAVTALGVVALGVLQGVALGVLAAVAVALHRLARTRITHEEREGVHHVHVRGQLTFLAVPRLSRTLHLVPPGADAVVRLDGSFMDHAAYESLRDWQRTHCAQDGSVELTGLRAGVRIAEPTGPDGTRCRCRPWTPWRNHQCEGGPRTVPASGERGRQLVHGLRTFQRTTAPHVRAELARLAREGQRPSQLFLTCADSRLVTSMITSSGPGDLFVVRNVGNLVPPPGHDGDASVAAAVEYAVDVLGVRSLTVCGHSGCGAMQTLLSSGPGRARTPLERWLRHGLPSLERLTGDGRRGPRPDRRPPADAIERLCLINIVQQLDHLRAHDPVSRALREGRLELHGMYFHLGEAQAYLLTETDGGEVFTRVEAAKDPRAADLSGARSRDGHSEVTGLPGK